MDTTGITKLPFNSNIGSALNDIRRPEEHSLSMDKSKKYEGWSILHEISTTRRHTITGIILLVYARLQEYTFISNRLTHASNAAFYYLYVGLHTAESPRAVHEAGRTEKYIQALTILYKYIHGVISRLRVLSSWCRSLCASLFLNNDLGKRIPHWNIQVFTSARDAWQWTEMEKSVVLNNIGISCIVLILLSLRMAQAGFYYTGVADEVACFHCHVTYKHWKYGDNAPVVHSSISPGCRFLNGQDKYNMAIYESESEGKHEFAKHDSGIWAKESMTSSEGACGFSFKDKKNTIPAYGYDADSRFTTGAKYPTYSELKTRLESFDISWKHNDVQNSSSLAEAGFYYAALHPYGGLQNPAGTNLCFANSLLQCLRLTDISVALQSHSQCEPLCFTCNLKKLLRDGPPSAYQLCYEMQDIWPEYSIGSQQDVNEMYQRVLEAIHSNHSLALHLLFYGEQESSVSCMECGQSSTTIENYNHFAVSTHQTSVCHNLSEHFAAEVVHDFSCPSCQRKVDVQKETVLLNIPTHVVIQLKRFDNNRVKVKIDDDLTLNISKKLECKARLSAVIVHYGTLVAGHYYCYMRHGEQWYKMDDMKVSKVNRLKNMFANDAYMLFYKKC